MPDYMFDFTREELNRIHRLFAANSSSKHVVGEGAQFSLRSAINFVSISHLLGLHRESYNYLGAHTLANQRTRSFFKMKQLYKSIEPVEEEQPNNDADNDYSEQQRMQNQRRFGQTGGGSSQIQKLKKLKKELAGRLTDSDAGDWKQDARINTMNTGKRNRAHLTSVTEEELAKLENDQVHNPINRQ